MVITFDRHPLETIAPSRAPRLLQDRVSRDAALRREGPEVMEVAFTPELCRLTAGEWIDILKREYGAEAIITGYDNTFGSDGRGLIPEDYVALGHAHGIDVCVAPELPGICSSAIRHALAEGEVKRAGEMLGRPFRLTGIVEQGKRIGHTIGVPTANLRVERKMMIPASGVYAAYVAEYDAYKAETIGSRKPAVVNIGNNPTIDSGNPVTIEAHILGFSGDLYGRRISIDFIDRIRGEIKFESLGALKARIEKDMEEGERILRNCEK